MKPSFFARNSFAILMTVAFLMPFMFMGTRRSLLSNKNDVKSWLPAAYEETTTFRWYREHFESDMFVLASWEGCTLDDPALDLLAKKLVGPEEKKWPPTELRFFKRAITGKQILAELIEGQGVPPEEALSRLKGFMIGPDGRQTCLVLFVCQDSEAQWEAERLEGKHNRQKFLHAVVEKVYSVAENECGISRDQIHLGGPPVDNAAIDTEGEKSLFRLAGVSALVGLFMSWWCLRSWSLTAMVFTTALFSAGLSLGIVWCCGDKMNCILLTMPSLVYVAAISGAVHLANYYRDTVRQSGLEGAADRAIRSAWLPLALATGTTAIGLASMCITELVPIRMFGMYSAIGVVVSFGVLCFYMPSLLEFWPLPGIAQPRTTRLIDPGLSPRWKTVGQTIIRRNGWVTVGCLALMALGTYGVTKVQTSVKLMRLFSPQARIIEDYTWLEKRLGPLVPMEVVVRVEKQKCKLDLLDQMILVGNVQRSMAGLPDVGSTQAAPTFARPLPKYPNLLERRTWIVQLEKHRSELRDYLYSDPGEELWRVSARVAALTSVDYGAFVQDIRRAVEPVLDQYRARGIEGISATYTGLVPLVYKSQSSMLDGLILNFVGDLILIGIAIIFLLRDWSAGFLLMIPSLFPMALVFGAMGWLGIVVDVGTVMTPAVAMGVTVDDAIHFMLWCRHGQERGMSRPEAIMFAYGDCARAIYQSWGIIGLGLLAFALSSFTPTQRFGYLMFVMLTISSIGNLVLLPALLAGPMGHSFWKRSRRHVPAQAEPQVEPSQELREDRGVPEGATIPMPHTIPGAGRRVQDRRVRRRSFKR